MRRGMGRYRRAAAAASRRTVWPANSGIFLAIYWHCSTSAALSAPRSMSNPGCRFAFLKPWRVCFTWGIWRARAASPQWCVASSCLKGKGPAPLRDYLGKECARRCGDGLDDSRLHADSAATRSVLRQGRTGKYCRPEVTSPSYGSFPVCTWALLALRIRAGGIGGPVVASACCLVPWPAHLRLQLALAIYRRSLSLRRIGRLFAVPEPQRGLCWMVSLVATGPADLSPAGALGLSC